MCGTMFLCLQKLPPSDWGYCGPKKVNPFWHNLWCVCSTHSKAERVYLLADQRYWNSKGGFLRKGGFPGVIGCLDRTHVRVQKPSQNDAYYVNRAGYHSINKHAICNHRGEEILKEWRILNCRNFMRGNKVMVGLGMTVVGNDTV